MTFHNFLVTIMSIANGSIAIRTPNHINPPNRAVELLTIELTLTVIAILFVVLRLISRYLITKTPGWDDYLIVVATVVWYCSQMVNSLLMEFSGSGAAANDIDSLLHSSRRCQASLGHIKPSIPGIYLEGMPENQHWYSID